MNEMILLFCYYSYYSNKFMMLIMPRASKGRRLKVKRSGGRLPPIESEKQLAVGVSETSGGRKPKNSDKLQRQTKELKPICQIER